MPSNSHGPRVLLTGSSGLIGASLTAALRTRGFTPVAFDLRGREPADIRIPAHLHRAIEGCVGIIHLAAVSRVIDAENNPEDCWATNVDGTQNVIDAARTLPDPPWLIYASSREVYGEPSENPVNEDAPRRPVNIYGRSKIEAEDRVTQSFLHTAIVRFSNVYGSTADHADRVIPAFARQAALGLPLRVDGRNHTFDFTHLDDTMRGILAVVNMLERGISLPPIHFVTGTPTTLGELAELAISLANSDSTVNEAPPRSYDVSRFYGDPRRAANLLDWRPQVALADGLSRLIQDFRTDASQGAQ